MAWLALFFSLGGCLTLGLGSVPGLLLGLVARHKARRQPDQYGGESAADAAIAISGIFLASLAIFFASGGYFTKDGIRYGGSVRAMNEATNVGDIRSLLSAEVMYAGVNAGFFDEPRCLAEPQACIPGYGPEKGAFLDAASTQETRAGFQRTFHAGPRPASAEIAEKKASRTSMRSFAFVAVPQRWGTTGGRAFCGDDTGVLRFTTGGRVPIVVDGRCAESSAPLK